MNYDTIWNAVDNLAKSLGLSPSGLAKKSGLDATTFNKSKRKRPDGKERWPSLDSLNKILEFCNLTFEEFYQLGMNKPKVANVNAIPYSKFSKLNGKNLINNGTLETLTWEVICFPDGTKNLYAVELDCADFEPTYRNNTTLILAKNSDIRQSDRIALFLNDKTVTFAEFIRRKPQSLSLKSLDDHTHEFDIELSKILFISRVVWASQ